MFKISLSSQFSENVLRLEKSGNILKVNGTPYDFSNLNDGDEIPADAIDNDIIVGSITKDNGVVNLTIVRPYKNVNAPESVCFPEPLILTNDGEVTFNEKDTSDD